MIMMIRECILISNLGDITYLTLATSLIRVCTRARTHARVCLRGVTHSFQRCRSLKLFFFLSLFLLDYLPNFPLQTSPTGSFGTRNRRWYSLEIANKSEHGSRYYNKMICRTRTFFPLRLTVTVCVGPMLWEHHGNVGSYPTVSSLPLASLAPMTSHSRMIPFTNVSVSQHTPVASTCSHSFLHTAQLKYL